jgi:endonuclease G, mitochondrial
MLQRLPRYYIARPPNQSHRKDRGALGQAPCNNEVLWAGLESAVRALAKDDDELFVVTGPVYPFDAQLQQIGNGVIVPPELFKAVFDPKLNQAAAYVSPNENELE